MIEIYAYDTDAKTFLPDIPVTDLGRYLGDMRYFLWVDFSAPGPEETRMLLDVFHLDELAVEDCLHPRQLPKLESFSDYHFFIVQGMTIAADGPHPAQVELNGFLADQYLITYHDDPVVPAIENSKRAIRQKNSRLSLGATYLAYEVLDQVIDMYLPVLDHLESKIQAMEKHFGGQFYSQALPRRYLELSSHLRSLRRMALKNQDVFYHFSHSTMRFISPDEARLFRDIYDHVVRVVELSDYYLQTLRDVLDIQFSVNSNRVNQIVQLLTVFTVIFLPLNVITGIYGMNFGWMPLLESPNGFWIILGVMLGVVGGMLFIFRRWGWI